MSEVALGDECRAGAERDAFAAFNLVVLMRFAALWKNGLNIGFIR
ncbi:hypothetical protein FHR95_002247 [Halomonas fontilapidosi]|uniref:Uncharacterized protein n=1 Tax=Halomonas fontilapidosi TaxID=616675 RepID=A0A7W5DLB9_9GAMM|nr:hypothetical protein [Halomonas fontilapidosi]